MKKQKSFFKTLIELLVFPCIAFVVVTVGCDKVEPKSRTVSKLETGLDEHFGSHDKVPDFELPMYQYSLETDSFQEVGMKNFSTFKGKPILINFWATWCAPCIRELPDLVKLNEELDGKVQIIFVNTDPKGNIEEVEKIVKKYGILNPTFMDPELVTVEKFHISGFPESFLIDQKFEFVKLKDPEEGRELVRIISTRDWKSMAMQNAIKESLRVSDDS